MDGTEYRGRRPSTGASADHPNYFAYAYLHGNHFAYTHFYCHPNYFAYAHAYPYVHGHSNQFADTFAHFHPKYARSPHAVAYPYTDDYTDDSARSTHLFCRIPRQQFVNAIGLAY